MVKILKRGGALLLCLFALCSCKSAAVNDADKTQSAEGLIGQPITISMAELHIADHPITKSLVYFADEVEKRTDGRVIVDVCPAELLGNENSAIAQVRGGSLELARVSSITMSEYSPSLTPLILPYVFENEEHMWNTVTSTFGDELLASVDGCEAIAWVENGARGFFASRPIYEPGDMKGKKVRVPNSRAMYAMLRSYGATPTTFDYSTTYGRIESGNVLGAENDIVSYYYFANNVVAPYFVCNNHSYAPSLIIASSTLKDKIGEADYNVLLECAKDTQEKSREIWMENEKEVIADLKSSGVQIIIPNDEHINEFRAAADSVYNEYPEYKDAIDIIKEIDK